MDPEQFDSFGRSSKQDSQCALYIHSAIKYHSTCTHHTATTSQNAHNNNLSLNIPTTLTYHPACTQRSLAIYMHAANTRHVLNNFQHTQRLHSRVKPNRNVRVLFSRARSSQRTRRFKYQIVQHNMTSETVTQGYITCAGTSAPGARGTVLFHSDIQFCHFAWSYSSN